MVTQYGMSKKFGLISLESVENRYLDGRPVLNCGDDTAAEIDQEVQIILKESYDKAKKLLEDNREVLDQIAEYLFEHETITGKEFMRIYRDIKGIPQPPEEEEKPPVQVQGFSQPPHNPPAGWNGPNQNPMAGGQMPGQSPAPGGNMPNPAQMPGGQIPAQPQVPGGQMPGQPQMAGPNPMQMSGQYALNPPQMSGGQVPAQPQISGQNIPNPTQVSGKNSQNPMQTSGINVPPQMSGITNPAQMPGTNSPTPAQMQGQKTTHQSAMQDDNDYKANPSNQNPTMTHDAFGQRPSSQARGQSEWEQQLWNQNEQKEDDRK